MRVYDVVLGKCVPTRGESLGETRVEARVRVTISWPAGAGRSPTQVRQTVVARRAHRLVALRSVADWPTGMWVIRPVAQRPLGWTTGNRVISHQSLPADVLGALRSPHTGAKLGSAAAPSPASA